MKLLAKSNGGRTQLYLHGTEDGDMSLLTCGWEFLDSLGLPSDFLLLLFLWPAFPFFGGAIRLSGYAAASDAY